MDFTEYYKIAQTNNETNKKSTEKELRALLEKHVCKNIDRLKELVITNSNKGNVVTNYDMTMHIDPLFDKTRRVLLGNDYTCSIYRDTLDTQLKKAGFSGYNINGKYYEWLNGLHCPTTLHVDVPSKSHVDVPSKLQLYCPFKH